MLKNSLIVIGLALLLPAGVFASTAVETSNTEVIAENQEAIVVEQEISILDWAKENAAIDLEIRDEVSGEVVSFRLALEILDLDANMTELEDLRDGASWISSLRAAWAQHKVSVQLRRIELLLRSAVKQQAVTEDIEQAFYDYIAGTREQIRE